MKNLKAVGVVTILILPAHAFCKTAKLLQRPRPMNPDVAIEQVDLELLSGLEAEGFANLLGNDDLEFWRNRYCVHWTSPCHTKN